jgi:hypothetical protein
MRCSTGLLDEVFVLHPFQEGQAMAMLAPQVPVPIMPLLEAEELNGKAASERKVLFHR